MSNPTKSNTLMDAEQSQTKASALAIGQTIPDVWADGTHGPIQLHLWAAGHFTMIFGHPSAYAALSERDVVTLASAQSRFSACGCRIIGITQSDPVTESAWIESISERHGIDVGFPILSDEDGRIAEVFGVSSASSDDGRNVATTIIIDPELNVRAVLEYPQTVGRDPEEVLRIVKSLRSARHP